MIVVIGLLALIAAVVLAVTGIASSSGSTPPLSDNFVTFGQHLTQIPARNRGHARAPRPAHP
jgi:hypothetical protein